MAAIEYPQNPQDLYQLGFDAGYKMASASAARIIDVLSDKIRNLEKQVVALEQRETAPAATSKPGTCVDGEPNTCTQPFNWDDGVPYCDTCGLYRQSVHHKRSAPGPKTGGMP